MLPDTDERGKWKKLLSEEKLFAKDKATLETYKNMLEKAENFRQDLEGLQPLYQAFARAFPEEESFQKAYEKNFITIAQFDSSIAQGLEIAEQYHYRLEEERGYLDYQRNKLMQEEENKKE